MSIIAPDHISEIKHNKEFNLATANTRQAKKWKNTTTSIMKFAEKLSRTVRTNETISDYLKMPKPDQDNIKDVGAFVGGQLKGGSRKKEDVANRHIIAFDIDYAHKDSIDIIKDKLKKVCFSIYSTHKHTPEKPRLRLIVYPDRPLLADEYQAVMRRLASNIDIETIDPSTYDVNRLMYWPSTAADGEFVFLHNDASFLPVDTVLSAYGPGDSWRDASLWPISSKETIHIDRLLKKQEDPLIKDNLIGAFCRNVTIYQALDDYLSDIYRKESNERYSFINGSSSNGVVIYEGKFAYSNHSTDPAHGMTCNAFDLIRIHKFSDLDADAEHLTPVNRLPSFKAMSDYARKIEGVKVDLIKHKLEIGPDDFDAFGVKESGADWLNELKTDKNGSIKPSWFNVSVIIRNDPALPIKPKFNLFCQVTERQDNSKQWRDSDTSIIKDYIGRVYDIDPSSGKFEETIDHVAAENSYHPIREYLESLHWDGKNRIETLFIEYLGAEDNEYTREAALCWFSAAVHRIYEPGHKFDYVVVLGGDQGILKTTFVRTLGKDKWFGELSSFDPKIAMEEVHGKWIIELAELAANNKQEIEQQKSFLSSQSTRVRMAYARRSEEYHRQCVFMGTTNSKEYLKDSTGNRRWWPIDVNVDKIDIDRLKADIDLIWAEAYESLYTYSKQTYLSDDAEHIAKMVQEGKREGDPIEGKIVEWLELPAAKDRYEANGGFEEYEPRDRVCVIEIWEDCLGYKFEPRPSDRRRIASIMDRLPGWKRNKLNSTRFGKRFGRQKGWLCDIVPF